MFSVRQVQGVVAVGTCLLASWSRPVAAQAVRLRVVGQWGGVNCAVAVSGDRAYLASGPSLVVLDISSAARPAALGRAAPLSDIILGVTVSGGYAYVAAGRDGLVVVDISNPAAPIRAGSYDPGGYVMAVAVSGD